jgi:hypothetical protein
MGVDIRLETRRDSARGIRERGNGQNSSPYEVAKEGVQG